MRIGVDVMSVCGVRVKTGLFNYVDQLTRHLQTDPDTQLTLYCGHSDGDWASEALPGRRVRALRPPPRFYRVWRKFAAFNRADVYLHNLQSDIGPITRGANVYCVPDVIPLAVPGCVPLANVASYRTYYDQAVANGAAILCWSEHAKRDLLTHVGGDENAVHVVPLAAGSEFVPTPPGELAGRLAPMGLTPGSYVLSVASLEPRKNYAKLLHAYARLLSREPHLPHRLVLAGMAAYKSEVLFAEASRLGLSDRLVHLGYANDLPALYSGAAAFAFPSRYEGFGLPPLEAMACGTPVVCSDATSLPEVVGDAALTFDPDDDAALAEHLRRLLTDPASREEYSQRGLRRAAQFSWEQTAGGYLRVMRDAAARRPGARQVATP